MKDYKSICKRILGDDIFEEIQKFEIYKPTTNTSLDPREIEIAMQVVPRSILSYVIKNVEGMENGGIKKLDIPFCEAANWTINKHGPDDYSGQIRKSNVVIYDFKYRSIPGMAMLLMTSLELYDLKDLKEVEENKNDLNTDKIQSIIDDRLKIYELINSVVSSKINVREAREDFINEKLNRLLAYTEEQKRVESDKENKKQLKLKRFLDAKQQEAPKEFEINFEKSEKAVCSDCGSKLFDDAGWKSGCICSGDDRKKKVWLKKTENGVKLKFSKGWDQENIQMLLQSIKKVSK